MRPSPFETRRDLGPATTVTDRTNTDRTNTDRPNTDRPKADRPKPDRTSADWPKPDRTVSARLFGLLAVVGSWISHTLVYLPAGPLSGSVHPYLLPVGVILLLAGAGGGTSWHRTLRDLRHRLTSDVPDRPGYPSGAVGTWWLLLGAAQLGIFLVQENAESRAAGGSLSGLGAVTHAHWSAIPIHLAVAGVLAVFGARLVRHRSRLEDAVRRSAGFPRRQRDRTVGTVGQARGRALTPIERWSSQRWERPPPAVA